MEISAEVWETVSIRSAIQVHVYFTYLSCLLKLLLLTEVTSTAGTLLYTMCHEVMSTAGTVLVTLCCELMSTAGTLLVTLLTGVMSTAGTLLVTLCR